jgi:hypothetical protein
MQTFRVAKEPFGWAVRVGTGVITPFWTLALAKSEAERLCERLRRHGVTAEVVIEDEPPVSAMAPPADPPSTHDVGDASAGHAIALI